MSIIPLETPLLSGPISQVCSYLMSLPPLVGPLSSVICCLVSPIQSCH